MNPDFISSGLLIFSVIISQTYSHLAFIPPNPTRQTGSPTPGLKDSLVTAIRAGLPIFYVLELSLFTFNAIFLTYSLFYPMLPSQTACPATLLSWTPQKAISIVTTIIGAIFRLRAYSNLGKDFTFDLKKPSSLKTDGIYAYVQHPSYTCLGLVVIGNLGLWLDLDGITGCTGISQDAVKILWTVGLAQFVLMMSVRVPQEETMLKEAFAEDWVRWHEKTARFIPYLF
jgi:protein-S-isoprenylcysteine O-methyltransferase Ste14